MIAASKSYADKAVVKRQQLAELAAQSAIEHSAIKVLFAPGRSGPVVVLKHSDGPSSAPAHRTILGEAHPESPSHLSSITVYQFGPIQLSGRLSNDGVNLLAASIVALAFPSLGQR